MQPLEATNKITEQQWLLGEACGIDTIMNLPQSIIDANSAQLEVLLAATQGDEDESEK